MDCMAQEMEYRDRIISAVIRINRSKVFPPAAAEHASNGQT